MQYYSESDGKERQEAVEAIILQWPNVTTRKMFGCPAYMVNHRLFAFLVNEGIVLTQLRQHQRAILSEDFPIQPFLAGERKIMHWTQVTFANVQKLPRIMTFVRKSYEEAASY